MSLTPHQRRTVRLGLLACLGLLGLSGLWVVRTNPPTEAGWYPPCMLHATTGLHCPGCGATRCLHAALNGEIEQAIAFNPLAPILLPMLGLAAVTSLWHWAWGTRPRFREPSKWWPIGLAVFLVLFGVVRNIPAYPFTLLAPHKI